MGKQILDCCSPSPALELVAQFIRQVVWKVGFGGKFMTGCKWDFIQELPENWRSFASPQLLTLTDIWRKRRKSLKSEGGELAKFNERLQREWAIETGIIENLYTLDRGTTQTLIEHGIEVSLFEHGSTNKPVGLVVSILKDHEAALQMIFDFIKQERDLSTSFIKELHSLLTRNQEFVDAIDSHGNFQQVKWKKGVYKLHPNSPLTINGEIHEYSPPEQVASEMDQLIKWHLEHQKNGVPPDIEAAWIHHRFTQIHPFQDGNGRLARAISSLILIRAGLFPLTIHRDSRSDYLSALEKADGGDLTELVNLFSERQKSSLLKAIAISEGALERQSSIEQVIAAAGERLKARNDAGRPESEILRDELSEAFRLAHLLEKQTCQFLIDISKQLDELPAFTTKSRSKVTTSADDKLTRNSYLRQTERIAVDLNYHADTQSFYAWVRLSVIEERETNIVFSFHSLGLEFLGAMAVSGFVQHYDKFDYAGSTIQGPFAICDKIFDFYYNEEEEALVSRFKVWLNDSVLTGLDQWRRQL